MEVKASIGNPVKYWISIAHYSSGDLRYSHVNHLKQLPINHSSGDWIHGFEFNNDFFMLMVII